MQSSYRLFKIFGISVELHFTFILLLLLFLLTDQKFFVVFVLVFFIVLIHELVHSLVAKGFGIKVPRITLTFIGGLANIEVPENPKREFLISLSGPMSNFLMLFIVVLAASSAGIPFEALLDQTQVFVQIVDIPSLLSNLFWINLILGAFNLLPGFPMDGGRVFRAFLAFFIDYIKATEIAVFIGRIIAVIFFFVGLMGNISLLIIAVFLFFSGGQELEVIRLKHIFKGMKAGNIAVPNPRYVNEVAPIKDFIDNIAVPEQTHYPVTDLNGRIVGLLHMENLKGIKGDISRLTARDFAFRGIDSVDAEAKVEDLLLDLMAKEFVLVIQNDHVVGYITPRHLLEVARFYRIRGA
jgi:Zn-dependent protease